MKSRFFVSLLLTISLISTFTGCGLYTLDDRLDIAEDIIENRLDAAEDAVENALDPRRSSRSNESSSAGQSTQAIPESTASNQLTQAEAEVIALQHAGFTADEVIGLHTEYDIDDGVSRYEVKFHQGYWEYEYDIHAETGVILSFDKDD